MSNSWKTNHIRMSIEHYCTNRNGERLNLAETKMFQAEVEALLNGTEENSEDKTIEALRYMIVRADDKWGALGLISELRGSLDAEKQAAFLVKLGQLQDAYVPNARSAGPVSALITGDAIRNAKRDYADATLASRYPEISTLSKGPRSLLRTAMAKAGFEVATKIRGITMDQIDPAANVFD